MAKALKRIINKDIKEIQKMNLEDQGIYVHFNEENMLEANAIIIGPKDTPYENGILYFVINFPKNYPFSPPKINYLSQSRYRIHPNLYVGNPSDNFLGKVCLSIINTWSGPKWTTIMHIGSVLLSIQSILDNNPIQNEPGYENMNDWRNKVYNRIVEYNTYEYLILKNGFKIHPRFEIFNSEIKDHLIKNKKDILKKIKNLKEEHNKIENIQTSIYGINCRTDYNQLYHHLKIKFDKI